MDRVCDIAIELIKLFSRNPELGVPRLPYLAPGKPPRVLVVYMEFRYESSELPRCRIPLLRNLTCVPSIEDRVKNGLVRFAGGEAPHPAFID